LNIEPEKGRKIISGVNCDKNFTAIIKEIDILNKNKTNMPLFNKNEVLKENQPSQFGRYKKNVKPDASCNIRFPWDNRAKLEKKSNPEKEALKNIVNDLVAGKIEMKEFESNLYNHNINPRTETINKHLRSAKAGSLNHKELMCSILNYKDVYI
jgi:hypothetical protein